MVNEKCSVWWVVVSMLVWSWWDMLLATVPYWSDEQTSGSADLWYKGIMPRCLCSEKAVRQQEWAHCLLGTHINNVYLIRDILVVLSLSSAKHILLFDGIYSFQLIAWRIFLHFRLPTIKFSNVLPFYELNYWSIAVTLSMVHDTNNQTARVFPSS